jgi:hypothetical protein
MADPLLGLHIAACHFFCSCNACKTKLSLGTIEERYCRPFDQCKYWPLHKIDSNEGWNDVYILTFQPQDDCDVVKLDKTLVHTLMELGKTISRSIVIGGKGAYVVDDIDSYYLVKWIEELHKVEEDGIVMVEDAPMMLFKRDWICRRKWFDKVVREKFWYTIGDTVVTVRMKSILDADLVMSPISEANAFPRVHPTVRDQVLQLHPHKLHA